MIIFLVLLLKPIFLHLGVQRQLTNIINKDKGNDVEEGEADDSRERKVHINIDGCEYLVKFLIKKFGQ